MEPFNCEVMLYQGEKFYGDRVLCGSDTVVLFTNSDEYHFKKSDVMYVKQPTLQPIKEGN